MKLLIFILSMTTLLNAAMATNQNLHKPSETALLVFNKVSDVQANIYICDETFVSLSKGCVDLGLYNMNDLENGKANATIMAGIKAIGLAIPTFFGGVTFTIGVDVLTRLPNVGIIGVRTFDLFIGGPLHKIGRTLGLYEDSFASLAGFRNYVRTMNLGGIVYGLGVLAPTVATATDFLDKNTNPMNDIRILWALDPNFKNNKINIQQIDQNMEIIKDLIKKRLGLSIEEKERLLIDQNGIHNLSDILAP